MTDVRLYQTNDGGEIDVVAGQLVMADGLETAAYLSLFGGNQEDSGIEGDDGKQWWGNHSEPELAGQYRSETQNILASLPATSGNLRRIEDAASRDLQWFTEDVADSVTVECSMPALNTVHILVTISIDGRVSEFAFTEPWKGRAQ
jgi:phage gp46-like protein